MGCSMCLKCKWIRNSAFCGTTKLTEKQLYAKNGFCSTYEPKEEAQATPQSHPCKECNKYENEKTNNVAEIKKYTNEELDCAKDKLKNMSCILNDENAKAIKVAMWCIEKEQYGNMDSHWKRTKE